ncbi:DUF808 domain-containing protein [Aestuariirhabdus sp. LZHN29]|uniref:DUF808 domain-containing protein n=1 Tax=Aestuariirhabdus sp. LZHN29 TaxID=3417462 RepID=UPI003CE7596A
MASGIFAILDDIAILLDDAAVMSKVAVKKTAALLGDDLAVNAEKATGFRASRELPVVWAITKGSMVNKLIILPLAFLLSAYLPGLIVPILLVGGAYLSYEGAEKVSEWFFPHKPHAIAAQESADPAQILKLEARKIKGAIRTDFILSIEIIVITLGTVIEQQFAVQVIVVSLIALLATVGVYGAVALLVRMDDTGFYLIERAPQQAPWLRRPYQLMGEGLVAALPRVIRLLGVVGTVAMLLVGGGMYVHNIDAVHHALDILPSMLPDLVVGLVLGTLLVACVKLIGALR